tara:strand:+ start:279 stop:428 length:150 start_codon:yes stop_codon:yes gene_type:complete
MELFVVSSKNILIATPKNGEQSFFTINDVDNLIKQLTKLRSQMKGADDV